MVGAGLMVRSLLKRQTLDIGIRPENLVVAGMRLDNSKYPGSEDSLQFEKRLVERLSAVPDLESFTIATHIPAAGTMYSPLTLPDRNIADRDGRPPDVEMIVIAPGYFRALGLTLPRGREFNENDGAPGIEAAIVNQSFVSKFWPGEEPIGKKIKLQNGPWLTVVGISPAIKQFLRDLEAEPRVYQPYRQYPYSPFSIIARSRSSDAVVAKMLREEVQKIDPDLPLYNIRTMQNYLNSTALPTQILSTMFSVFAIIGLVLSSVGIYAVTAYATNRRTQEIGVRMALGAGSRDVLWLVLRLGLKQLAVGLPIGLAAAFAVSRLLAVQLFQVTPLDPMTFVSIPVLLTLITLAACLVPARRAARLNAVEALRME
jgi:putative ABC transport system permease protein